MDTVIDLDILRPAKKIIRLNKQDIDISFIPAGITFDLDAIVDKMTKLNMDEVAKGGKEANKAFELGLELCSIFCITKHPEMTVEWFRENTDPNQVRIMADNIKESLAKLYSDMGEFSKNVEAGQ